MCGRFSLAASDLEIKKYFELSKGCIMRPRYNIAPEHMIPAIRSPGTQIDFFKWGLVPAWIKADRQDSKGYMNARAETLFEKPTFKKAISRQRCIIPATGYYEWMQIKGKKQPYYISLKTDDHDLSSLFGFAGIWDSWQDKEGNQQEGCAIITIKADHSIASIHDRMPFILSKEQHKLWFSIKTSQVVLQSILAQAQNCSLYQFYPVSNRMNNPHFDTLQCIQSL